MTKLALMQGSAAFQLALEAVTRELVTIEHVHDGAFVKTPLTYPGGSSVVVRVSEDRQGYFVTDFGMGLEEAEQMGVSPSAFARYAHVVAESTGTRFDNHSFFAVQATKDELAGAIVAIANASQAAVANALYGMADKTGQFEAQLFERLQLVFKDRRAKVLKKAEIKGFSSTPWQVDALVIAHGHQTAFEAVSKHPVSITSAATKFFDIARIGPSAPRRIAVVKSKRELGTYLNVLSQAASVIEDTVANDVFVELAEAA